MADPRLTRLRAALIDAALELLAAVEGPRDTPLAVQVVRGATCLTVRPDDLTPPLPLGLTPLQQRIRQHLTVIPRPAKRLASIIGHRYDSYFRGAMRWLCDHNHARRTSHGYSLPLPA